MALHHCVSEGSICPKPNEGSPHLALTPFRSSSLCAARCSGSLGHYRAAQSGITAVRSPHRCEVCSETRRGGTLTPRPKLSDAKAFLRYERRRSDARSSKAASVGGLFRFTGLDRPCPKRQSAKVFWRLGSCRVCSLDETSLSEQVRSQIRLFLARMRSQWQIKYLPNNQ